jgi:hypothetical protein
MKSKTLFGISFFTLFLFSCTTTKSFISDSANLERYEYATISSVMGYTGSAQLMDMDVRIYNIVVSSRLKMIGEKEIENLSTKDKEKLLLVKYSATQSDDESVVSITFVDYLTSRPIATCRGAFGFGWTPEHDMNVALERVKVQVKDLF